MYLPSCNVFLFRRQCNTWEFFATMNAKRQLPNDFFDDVLKEAKVRKIDVKKEMKKMNDNEWKQFKAFVNNVEDAEDTADPIIVQRDEMEEEMEQMEYLNQFRLLLEKRIEMQGGDQTPMESEIEVQSKDTNEEEEDIVVPTSNASLLQGILQKKKKKKRDKRKEMNKFIDC